MHAQQQQLCVHMVCGAQMLVLQNCIHAPRTIVTTAIASAATAAAATATAIIHSCLPPHPSFRSQQQQHVVKVLAVENR
jgi:hypothetical protein